MLRKGNAHIAPLSWSSRKSRLAFYKEKLEKDEHCDLVLPLCHLYEFQDEMTCQNFDFPVILSGHDHHVVDRHVNGTRLLGLRSQAPCIWDALCFCQSVGKGGELLVHCLALWLVMCLEPGSNRVVLQCPSKTPSGPCTSCPRLNNKQFIP